METKTYWNIYGKELLTDSHTPIFQFKTMGSARSALQRLRIILLKNGGYDVGEIRLLYTRKGKCRGMFTFTDKCTGRIYAFRIFASKELFINTLTIPYYA